MTAKYYFFLGGSQDEQKAKKLINQVLIGTMLGGINAGTSSTTSNAETLDKGSSAPVEVSTYTELLNAIIDGKDGDTIIVTGQIDVPAGISLGGENMHFNLKKGNETAKIIITSSPDAFPTAISNFTFDGCEITSASEFISIYHDVIFSDVNFINCTSNFSSGAVYAAEGESYFRNCLFDNNSGIVGGHIALNSSATVHFENCILKNGYAIKGGAVSNGSTGSTCTILSSIITDNEAGDIGGGISNSGVMTIEKTKLYNNKANNGGSDIANDEWGRLTLQDSLDSLVGLFADEELTPTGWFYDYSKIEGIRIPGMVEKIEYTLLKLQFGQQEEPTPEEPDQQPEPDEEEPQPEEPTPEPEQEPEPEPVKPPTSPSRGTSSWGSYTVTAKKEEPAPKAVVLTNGKATLDTAKTEYLLGFSDGLLGSKGTVTRAELAQIVYRLLTPESKADVHSNKNSFKDVAANAWYNEAVSTLFNAGLISMGADGKFNPDENITWGEMVAILAKFAEPNHEWKIITKHWARDALNTAISNRWFEYNDQFNPDGEVTRLEMLNFINTMFAWTTK